MSKKRKYIAIAELTTFDEVPPPPPPLGFISPFKTIQEWLLHLCDTNHAVGAISEYQFSLGQLPSGYMLSVLGFNTYDGGENIIDRRIDFKPASHIYFILPKEEFANLSQQQVEERVLHEIVAFIHSDKFQDSFLSKGNSIRISFAGRIWPK